MRIIENKNENLCMKQTILNQTKVQKQLWIQLMLPFGNVFRQFLNNIMDWKSEKAFLEQETQLLEMQLLELREREDSYKFFNESILNAYNSMQNDVQRQNSIIHKQLQQTLEEFSKDLIESKNRNTVILQQLEKENRELKDQLEILEYQIKEQDIEQKRELQEFEELFSISQQQLEPNIIIEQKRKRNEDKENNKPEHGEGCIISLKSRNQEVIRKELNLSNVLNCKNSNIMEVSQIDWLDQSSPLGLFRQYQLFQRGRDNSIHSQRIISQFSKRDILSQRKSKDSVSPSYIKDEGNINNTITSKSQLSNNEMRLITHKQLPEKDNYKQENYSKGKNQKRSLDEFTRQLNSFKSTQTFSKVYRQSQLS
ncbi:unnamed protein product [Paramecium sonneborni]|uniref:Uncharacterized protein n=1 Tax=Paramecium sonneborni TaxID=65129 RepID=A0A8S1N0E4_9CILI|nr:unnamed protein product [Paramecium sonneborni]